MAERRESCGGGRERERKDGKGWGVGGRGPAAARRRIALLYPPLPQPLCRSRARLLLPGDSGEPDLHPSTGFRAPVRPVSSAKLGGAPAASAPPSSPASPARAAYSRSSPASTVAGSVAGGTLLLPGFFMGTGMAVVGGADVIPLNSVAARETRSHSPLLFFIFIGTHSQKKRDGRPSHRGGAGRPLSRRTWPPRPHPHPHQTPAPAPWPPSRPASVATRPTRASSAGVRARRPPGAWSATPRPVGRKQPSWRIVARRQRGGEAGVVEGGQRAAAGEVGAPPRPVCPPGARPRPGGWRPALTGRRRRRRRRRRWRLQEDGHQSPPTPAGRPWWLVGAARRG